MTSDKLALLQHLETELPGQVRQNVLLSKVSRWQIGGPADIFVEPRSVEAAARAMRVLANYSTPMFVMGDASNTLFDDSGFRGVVLHVGRNLSSFRIDGNRVWAQAGIWVPRLISAIGSAGLAGAEHAIGIPGTLGGLIVMNGGSQRKGIGLNVKHVVCADARGQLFQLNQEQCGFAYRTSTLQSKRAVVLEAELEFSSGDRTKIRGEMLGILRERRRKFPRKLPNCGSTFLSNPAMYATIGPPGRAIEDAGLKGVRRGGAMFSPLHANFIVNTGGASSRDVLGLIALARREVAARTGYLMDCEVRYLGPTGELAPAHIPAEQLFPSG